MIKPAAPFCGSINVPGQLLSLFALGLIVTGCADDSMGGMHRISTATIGSNPIGTSETISLLAKRECFNSIHSFSSTSGSRFTDLAVGISKTLSQSDQLLISEAEESLPLCMRTTVEIVTPDGRTISSRGLIQKAGTFTQVQANGRVWRDSMNQVFAVPDDTVSPDIGGTGLYRRFLELSGENAAAVGGYIDLPCSPTNIPSSGTPDADTGYVYTGGSSSGDAIDVGLQYSPTYGSYEVYYQKNGSPIPLSNDRYGCGVTIYMGFSVAGPTELFMQIQASAQSNGTTTGAAYVLPNISASEVWNTAGTGMTLKHFLSLAQSQTQNDGYYFGIVSKQNQSPTFYYHQWDYDVFGTTQLDAFSSSNTTRQSSPADGTRVIVRNPDRALDENEGLFAHQ